MNRFMMTTALSLLAGLGAAQAQVATAADDGASLTCETPWQTVDQDNSRTVSPEEADRFIEASFALLDNDGDGTVTRGEYRDCLARSTSNIDDWPERDEESFASADTNSDESLDRSEYGRQASSEYDRSRRGDAADYGTLRSFVLLLPDEVQDQEFMESLSAEEAAARAAYGFSLLDRNGDAKVSKSEWNDDSSPKIGVEEHIDASFDELDGDSSGSLTHEEFNAAKAFDVDATTTASTTKSADSASASPSGASSASAGSDSGSDTMATDGEIPVFLYVFGSN